jgi:hypothetical protein
MTESLITYIFLGVIAIFVILSFAIGLEKMIRIILGNYILWLVCFATSASIKLAIETSTNETFVKILTNWESFIILFVYLLLLFLIYHKSKINIDIPNDQIMQKSMYLFFVPLTVLSMCLTLEIILLGTNILSQEFLLWAVEGVTNNIYLTQFIVNTPYWILIHAVATILMTSGIRTKINTDVV